jgi:hypothetical protein
MDLFGAIGTFAVALFYHRAAGFSMPVFLIEHLSFQISYQYQPFVKYKFVYWHGEIFGVE